LARSPARMPKHRGVAPAGGAMMFLVHVQPLFDGTRRTRGERCCPGRRARFLPDLEGASQPGKDQIQRPARLHHAMEVFSPRHPLPAKRKTVFWEGSTTVLDCSLHCRMAKFRGLRRRGKYGAVIGLKVTHSLVIHTRHI